MDKLNPCFVNSRSKPYVPKGWEIIKHVKIKSFLWNRKSAVLHKEEEQEHGFLEQYIINNRLKRRKKIVLNMTVLEFLLKHKKRIPKSWKGKTIDFPGTIYQDNQGMLRIPYLVRYHMRGRHGHWHGEFSWDFTFKGVSNYTALLAEK